MKPEAQTQDGLQRCGRYSFGPNRLHYCGPDANREMLEYIKAGASDGGLEILLRAFKTLYPYLLLIARANGLADPFDDRVVAAYWLGNELLENVGRKKFYEHLLREQELKKRLGAKSFELVAEKLRLGAVPHHSFHVFSVSRRTGHFEQAHTLESMDSCRISWGKVIKIDGPSITAAVAPLLYGEKKLHPAPFSGKRCGMYLGEPTAKKFSRNLESEFDIEQLKIGDLVSIHWGVICEIITPREAAQLKKYTLRHLVLANQTI